MEHKEQTPQQDHADAPPANPLSWQADLGTLRSESHEPSEQIPDILAPADPNPHYQPQPAAPDPTSLAALPSATAEPPAPPILPFIEPSTLPVAGRSRRRTFFFAGVGILLVIAIPVFAWLSHSPSKPARPLANSSEATTIPLTAPLNLTLAADDSGLNISWQAVRGASSYTVEYATDPDFTQNFDTQTVKDATSLHIDLLAAGRYYVRVAAQMGNDQSDFTESQVTEFAPVATPAPVTPSAPASSSLPAPGKPSLSVTGSSSLKVSWSSVTGAQKYRVEYTYRSNTFSGAFWQESNGTSLNLSGLNASTTYYVRVAGYAGGSFGAWSGSASATTQAAPAPVAPKMPSNVRLTPGMVPNGATATYINAVWTAGDSSARAEILWSGPGLLNQPRAPKGDGGGGATSDRANGLKLNTTYCFQVREYSGSTPGPWTNKVCATTNG